MIGIKDQCFGVEIELTGITRAEAAEALAAYFETTPQRSYDNYDSWYVPDREGKQWRIMSDGSIRAEWNDDGHYRRTTDPEYRVEMVTPKLTYDEMEKFQECVRRIRQAGGKVNDSCGMHVHALPDTTGGDTISSGNWIIDNLNSSLETWNSKLSEIWTLLTTSPENFKGGGIWNVIVGINDALKAIAYALLVLFFVIGVMKTCGSFTELKRPEVAFKCFIRFVLAQAAVTYGMELMTALFSIAQGAIQTIMGASGLSAMEASTLPAEIASTIEDVGLLESIPLWAVTLLGSLFIWVLSLVMILTVYGRFFKLYMATAIAPIPLSSFAGQPSSSIGMAFIKSYAAICLEGCVILLACIIFSQFASSPPVVTEGLAPATVVWNYIGELVFNMLVLVGSIKMSDRIIRELMGLG